MFPAELETELLEKEIESYFCFQDTTSLFLAGNQVGGSLFGVFNLMMNICLDVSCGDIYTWMDTGLIIELLYVDGYINPVNNPPVGYKLVEDFIYPSSAFIPFNVYYLKFNTALTFDGRFGTYFTIDYKEVTLIKRTYNELFIAVFLLDEQSVAYIESAKAIYVRPTRRNLENTTSSVTETREEEKKMSIIYSIFYMMSNIGGLYLFLIFIMGTFLRPIVNKIFYIEALDEIYQANQKLIVAIVQEEELIKQKKKQKSESILKNKCISLKDKAKLIKDSNTNVKKKMSQEGEPNSHKAYSSSLRSSSQRIKKDIKNLNGERDIILLISKVITLDLKADNLLLKTQQFEEKKQKLALKFEEEKS